MKSKINQILEKIDNLKQDLIAEYEKLTKKYEYLIQNKKIVFTKKIKDFHKTKRDNLFKYVFTANVRNLLSAPFIYSMIIPTVILDIFLIIYQQTAFRLYGIPLVKRSDFIIYDRRFLKYLNLLQKINCLYCAYVNGLYSYATEVAARTEQFWCPIKHASRNWNEHKYFKYFADYWDSDGFKEVFNKNICFKKID